MEIDRGKRIILLIEYDEDLQQSTRRIFDWEGWGLRIAASIGEARLRALERPVDAVLLDPDLPDGCGLEFLPELRALTGGAPVLALSGWRVGVGEAKAMGCGASDFLQKPFTIEELRRRMRALLETDVGRDRAKADELRRQDGGDDRN